jgi:hypothetical protein
MCRCAPQPVCDGPHNDGEHARDGSGTRDSATRDVRRQHASPWRRENTAGSAVGQSIHHAVTVLARNPRRTNAIDDRAPGRRSSRSREYANLARECRAWGRPVTARSHILSAGRQTHLIFGRCPTQRRGCPMERLRRPGCHATFATSAQMIRGIGVLQSRA